MSQECGDSNPVLPGCSHFTPILPSSLPAPGPPPTQTDRPPGFLQQASTRYLQYFIPGHGLPYLVHVASSQTPSGNGPGSHPNCPGTGMLMCPGEAERAKVASGGRTATPHSALAWKSAARSPGPGQGLQALGSQEEPGRTSCLHVQIPTGVCWLCALHLPATGKTLSFRCPLHQGPSASPEEDQREAGCVFGRTVTNAAGLLPACPRDGSDGSWASLPLHCPPLPCSPLHASLSQLLPVPECAL